MDEEVLEGIWRDN